MKHTMSCGTPLCFSEMNRQGSLFGKFTDAKFQMYNRGTWSAVCNILEAMDISSKTLRWHRSFCVRGHSFVVETVHAECSSACKKLISNFMSACLADNRDAHDNDDSDNEQADMKLSGQVDVAEVHRIIRTKPTKQQSIRMKHISRGKCARQRRLPWNSQTSIQQRASLENAKWYSKAT